jgi:YcxB-like protein
MIVKTKKTQLDKKEYIKLAFENLVKSFWWALVIPFVWCLFYFAAPSMWWFITGAIMLVILVGGTYLLLWTITKNAQFEMLFQKYAFHIDSRSLTLMVNAKQGSPLQWSQIQRVELKNNDFVLYMNRATMFVIPEKAFANPNDYKFTKSIMEKKGLFK